MWLVLAACDGAVARTFDPQDASAPPASSFGPQQPLPEGCFPGPDNYDVAGNGCDDDADGRIDNAPVCDELLTETGTAEQWARAIGICARPAVDGYGLIAASYTKGFQVPDGANASQHGVLAQFGNLIRAREGNRFGVLSTGYAQEFDGAPGRPFARGEDWRDDRGRVPPGFPKAARDCTPISDEVRDVIAVRLELQAPRNASGFSFDFNFFTAEWPRFVCTQYNDGFLAYLQAPSFQGGAAGNISFDALQNSISVNNGFFDRCTPGALTGCEGQRLARSECPGTASELSGTGFGLLGRGCEGDTMVTMGGATGWLTSSAPVQAGERFTLELMIWDTGDGLLDSSVLVDRFAWLAGEARPPITDRPR